MGATEEERAAARENLTLAKRPLDVLRLFSMKASAWARQGATAVWEHTHTQTYAVPAIIAFATLKALCAEPGVEASIASIEHAAYLAFFWVGLGIASSVGLGTGLHSGLLFVFPHTFSVVQQIEACGHTDVNPLEFSSPSGASKQSCLSDMVEGGAGVPFWDICWALAPVYFLWGSGTAIGEIPPYAISRAAAEAGKKNAEFEEMTGERSGVEALNQMKDWMVGFLQTNGFVGVLLMASWPNMAFDLCGVCCGHFRMPFWTFFGATWMGKACFKANFQLMGFVTLFSKTFLDRFVAAVAPKLGPVFAFAGKPDFDLACALQRKQRLFSPMFNALETWKRSATTAAAIETLQAGTPPVAAAAAAAAGGSSSNATGWPLAAFEAALFPHADNLTALGGGFKDVSGVFEALDQLPLGANCADVGSGGDGILEIAELQEASSLAKDLGGYVMVAFLGWFLLDTVQEFAKLQQAEIDEEELAKDE